MSPIYGTSAEPRAVWGVGNRLRKVRRKVYTGPRPMKSGDTESGSVVVEGGPNNSSEGWTRGIKTGTSV